MPQAKDIPQESKLFAMFVGRYDTGKTTALASFPGKKYIMDYDERISSLRGRDDVEYDTFNSTKGFKDADDKLTTLNIKSLNRQLPYNMVGLDSLSTLGRAMIVDAVRLTGGIDPATKKVRGRAIGHLSMPTLQDYGYEFEAVYQLVYEGLKTLNCNVVMTAHTKDKYKVITEPGKPPERVCIGETIVGRPELMAQLPVMFNEIYYFSKEINADGSIHRFVEFDGDVARTTYPELAKARKVEITGVGFYNVWSSLLSSKNTINEEQKKD